MSEKIRKPFRDAEGSIIKKEVERTTHTGRTRTETIYFARVRFTDLDGNRREKKRTASSYNEALNKRRELHEEIAKELDPSANETEKPKTFNELVDYFEAEYVKPVKFIKNRKISGLRENLDSVRRDLNLFRKIFGKRLIKNITYEDLRKFKEDRLNAPVVIVKKFKTKLGVKGRNGLEKVSIEKKPVKSQRSIASVHRELARLKRIFYVALQKEWLRENPFAKGDALIRTKDETVRVRVLSSEEEHLLYKECTGQRAYVKNIISFAIDTFMRRGEIFKMTWKMVDLEKGKVNLPAQITKTLQARTVPLSSRALKILNDLAAEPHRPSDRVFGVNSINSSWDTIRARAGMEDLHFHDLRATGITRLLRAGMREAEVMKFSGHSDYRTFMKYVRPDENTFEKAKILMDTFIESNEEKPDNYDENR